MAKDYAKKYNSSRKSPRGGKQKNSSGNRLWLIALICIIVFAAGLYFLKHESARQTEKEQLHTQAQQQAVVKKTKTKIHPEAAQKQNVDDNSSEQPRFDFYTVLPSNASNSKNDDLERMATSEKQKLDHAADATADPGKLTTGGYILQLGVFNKFADADQLKAKLVLEGFDVNLSAAKSKNGVVYRVWMGIYQAKHEAQKQQSALQAEQVASDLIKLPMKE